MPKDRIITLTLNPSIDHILTVDSLFPYDKNIIESMRTFYGGKGINVAYALGKLKSACAATGFMGEKEMPIYTDKLSRAGVHCSFIPVQGQIRSNFKVMDNKKGKDTEFNQNGFFIEKYDLERLFANLESLLVDCAWLALCGSLPPGLGNDSYKEIIQIADQYNVRTCLDTSGEELSAAIQAKPTLLRCNLSELQETTKTKFINIQQIIPPIQALLRSGIEMAVISMGKEGVVAGNKGQSFLAEIPRVDVKSLTGAGDVLTAGMLFALSEQKPFKEALRFSSALATASTSNWSLGILIKKILK